MTQVRRRGLGGLLAATAAGIIAVTGMAGPAAAQPRPQTASSWPQFQGDAGHTGAEPGETSVTAANVSQLSTAWTAALTGQSYNSEVAVSGGIAYVAAGNTVTALNVGTGTQLWQKTVRGSTLGTPAVRGGLVLVADSQRIYGGRYLGFVAALNSATGATVWQQSAAGFGQPSLGSSVSVTTAPGRAYVMESGQVVALTLLHGKQIWTSPVIAGCDPSQPSVYGNYVVVGGGGTDVTALNAADGTVAWHRSFGTGCGFSAEDWIPAISNGRVYVGLVSRGVAALSLTSGAVRWHNKSLGSSVFFPLSLTGGEVIVSASDNDHLAALKQSNGSIIWQSSLPGGGFVAQLATFGSVAWGLDQSSGSAQPVALDPLTGRDVYLGTSYPDDVQGFSPTVYAGHVLVNLGNEVVCLVLPGAG